MASALAHVSWENCVIDPRRDRALEAYARRKTGIPYPLVRYFIPVPWLARAIVDRGLLPVQQSEFESFTRANPRARATNRGELIGLKLFETCSGQSGGVADAALRKR
jgi:hypothetical protein